MNSKSLVLKVALGLVVICSALAAAFLLWSHGWGQYSSYGVGVSKDQKLAAIFDAHRRKFEKVEQMAAEDAQRGLYLDAPYFKGSKFSTPRRNEYEKLISAIHPGIEATMDGYGDGMRFIFAGGGTSAIGPGWVKGIEYVPGSYETNGAIYSQREVPKWQGLISTNLDNVQTLRANVYLRPIQSNWFIFYQRTD